MEQASEAHRGKISGLSWETERCPDAQAGDGLKPAAIGGLIGFGLGHLLRAAPRGRLLLCAAGAFGGFLASRHHLNVDWDPDALRGGSPKDPPSQAQAPAPDSEQAPEAPEDDDPPSVHPY